MNISLMIMFNTALSHIIDIRLTPGVLYIGINPMFFFGVLACILSIKFYNAAKNSPLPQQIYSYARNAIEPVRQRLAEMRS